MLSVLLVIAMTMSLMTTFASAATEEIVDKGGRVTWVDASVQLPNNYASIIGFKLTFKLVTDHTNYVDGYGGVTEDPTAADYNMKFPCYMLVASKGAHGTDEFNENTFGCSEDENYEHYMDADLAKSEIVKIGVGAGYYVAGYMDNGRAYQSCSNMVAGDTATVTYKGTEALFEQGNPILTFYGYTAEFEILSIEWITGTPVVSDEIEWDTVEKNTYANVSTAENESTQNGSNYVNIITPKEGDGLFPVVLWIHGGGWTTSSRTDIILNNTMEYFLAQGYAFVSVEYTLSERDAELTEQEEAKIDACETEAQKEVLKKLYSIKNDSQLGAETGNIFADILMGKSSPSGKLSTTWAKHYEDYPSATNFATAAEVRYEEGAYVGYRYFESFHVKPQFAFGYGLGYTDFAYQAQGYSLKKNMLLLQVAVQNIGHMNGKETLQVYYSHPEAENHPARQLIAYQKSALLAGGECQKMDIAVDLLQLAIYRDGDHCFVIEKGKYQIYLGNCVDHCTCLLTLLVGQDFIVERVAALAGGDVNEINCSQCSAYIQPLWGEISWTPIEIEQKKHTPCELPDLKNWTVEKLAAMCVGVLNDMTLDNNIGNSGKLVAGSAGETYSCVISYGRTGRSAVLVWWQPVSDFRWTGGDICTGARAENVGAYTPSAPSQRCAACFVARGRSGTRSALGAM